MKPKTDFYSIFGLNFRGMLAAVYLKVNGENVALIDNDRSKNCDDYYMGIPCLSPNDMPNGCSVIISVRGNSIKEISKQIEGMDIKESKVLTDDKVDKVMKEMDDELYIRCLYRFYLNGEIDLEKPVTFNEKLNWLKLHDRREIYTKMVDKYAAKEFVGDIIGMEHIIPAIGIWDDVDSIPFDTFPKKFVIKCTHDSGSVVVVNDRDKFDREKVKADYRERLKQNYFYPYREWPYKDVKPRILAEKYMETLNGEPLVVYKLFCFNGLPKIAQIIQNDKFPNESIDYVDMDFCLMDIRQNFPNSKNHLNPPDTWEEMKEFASKLSEGIPFIRVDFYEIEHKLYFSEFTFYSDAGMVAFEPEKWDKILGDWISLDTGRFDSHVKK